MQNRVQKMLKRFFADKLKRRRLTAVVSALSVLVVVGVFLQLMQPVITMTPDPVCGKEAHAHGDACYEQLLTCTSAEEGHVHGEACYANTLTCGKEAHEHVDACYPETVEEPTVPPTEEPAAVVTEAPAATSEPEESETPSETDGSAGISAQTEEGDGEVQPTEEAAGEATAEPTEEATGEATAEPTEEATGEATAEPTEEVTGEATTEPTEEVTGEATAEPTVETTGEATTEPTVETTGEATTEPTVEATGEATAEPTEEATVESTEEPTAEPTEEVVVPLTLEGLTVDRAAAKVGEAITWQFSVAGAEKIEYVIVDEAGSVMAGSELTANYISWTASHAGKYTIIVTAYAGEDVASVSGEVTAQDTAELTASVWSDALYCFAGQDVTFNLAKSGETEITACEITVVQNGKVLDSRTEFAETVTVTTEAQSDVTDVTLTLTLTDAAGAVVTAAHTIPCPVKVVETEAEWKQAADIGELSGVWADDLLAIAKKQIGYFESDVNFIINEEGRHGYTRYGDWYGQPYREWCAMFLSYCLEYAEVPEEYIPRHASSSDWMDELRYLDLFSYRTAEDCEPAAGDLIFFDWNEDGVPEHIGMVSEVTETLVHTIEGNAEAAVRAREYAKGDKQILGYGLITKAYEQYVEDITPDEDMTSVSGRTGVITASKANLRAAADASSERIDTLTEGVAVSILSAEQNEDGFWWYQLAAGELTGYVRSDLVALDEVVPTAEPTAEPTPEPTPEPTAEPTPAPTEEPVDPNTLYGSLMLQIRALTAPEQPAADADEETLAAYQAAQAQYEASRAALNERILTSYASADLTDEEYRKLDAALTGAPEPTAEPTPEATFAPTLEPTAEPTPTLAPNPVQVSMEIEVVDEEAETANIIMTAALTGISAEDYLWQWQVSATGEEPWENIEGATGLTLTIPLSEESYNAFYRIYGDYIEPAEAAEPQVTAEPTAPAEQAAAYGMRTMSLSMDEQPSAGEDAAAAETAGIAPAEETSGAQTFAITTGGDVASDANTPAVASVAGESSEATWSIDVYYVAVVGGVLGEPEGASKLSATGPSWPTTNGTEVTVSFDSSKGTLVGSYIGEDKETTTPVYSISVKRSGRLLSSSYTLQYRSVANGGWIDVSDNDYSIYIRYTPAGNTVTFDYNGGFDIDGATVSDPLNVNAETKLIEGTIPTLERVTKPGYYFSGLWTKENDTAVGATYTAEQIAAMQFEENATFTAQWTMYDVTFNNGLTGEESKDEDLVEGELNADGTVKTEAMPAWTREGYTITGWTAVVTDENGNETQTDNVDFATYVITGNTVFTAQWAEGYTVTFKDSSDGTNAPVSAVYAKDSLIPVADIPAWTKAGYLLMWSVEGDNTGILLESADVAAMPITADVTYVANWVKAVKVVYQIPTDENQLDLITRYGSKDSDPVYDADPQSWIESDKPDIRGGDTYEESILLDSEGSYEVLSPSKDTWKAVSKCLESNVNGERLFTYHFTGWLVEGTDTVIKPDEYDAQTIIEYDTDKDGVIELTAQWSALTDEGRPATVAFFIAQKSSIRDTLTEADGSVGNYSDAVFTTEVFGIDEAVAAGKISTSEFAERNYPVLGGDKPTTANAIAWDDAIRDMEYGAVENSDATLDSNGLWLRDFPSDEECLARLRTYANRGGDADSITLDGIPIDPDQLTTENFTIRWFVFKRTNNTAWHIDGKLVPKQAALTITKTFYGDSAAIEEAKEDFSITLSAQGGTITDNRTLTLEDADEISGDKYTWILEDLVKNTTYLLKENVTKVGTVNGIDIAELAEYMLNNSPDQENGKWKTYNSSSGIEVKPVTYYADVSEGNYQTVNLLNSYIPTNTVVVRKGDATTGKELGPVTFLLSKVGEGLVVEKDNSEAGKYYLYTTDNDDVDADPVTLEDGKATVTTDASGRMLLVGLKDAERQGTYQLKEKEALAGYSLIEEPIEFTIDGDGNVSLKAHNNAYLTQDYMLHVTNESFKTEVTVKKDWADGEEEEEVVLRLMRNGETVGQVTLDGTVDDTETMAWQYTWEDMPLFVDGEAAVYTAREERIGDEKTGKYYNTDYSGTNGYIDYVVTIDPVLYTNQDGTTTTDPGQITDSTQSARIVVHNKRYTGELIFNKVDQDGAALGGAVFTVYSDEACTRAVTTATSQSNGSVTLKLSSGVYYMKETAPSGYKTNSNIYKLEITSAAQTISVQQENGDTVTYVPMEKVNNRYQIVNTKAVASITVVKTDEDGNPLEGATFQLKLGGQSYTVNGTDSATFSPEIPEDGTAATITLQDLIASGSTYTITETIAPAGYYPMTGVIAFKITDGVVEVVDADSLQQKGVEWDAGTNTFTIKNHTGSELPSTGGAGTLPYTLGGLLMMAVSLVYGLGLKRRRERGTAR